MIHAFLPSDTDFTSNGERPVSLLKAIEKKDKDTWEVEISASLDYLDVIKQDYILHMPTKYGYQPFRIDNPETINNSIRSIAKHIAYDLKNYLVTLATPIEMNCTEAMNEVLTHAYPSCSFSVYSDIASIKTFSIENMTLFDAMVELSKRYNGHLDFDGFQVRITAEQGEDRGVNIEYGANLQGAKVTRELGFGGYRVISSHYQRANSRVALFRY
jgi:phage minor structural protein